jgi:hypothetical protein
MGRSRFLKIHTHVAAITSSAMPEKMKILRRVLVFELAIGLL